jgi:hypothetical protein
MARVGEELSSSPDAFAFIFFLASARRGGVQAENNPKEKEKGADQLIDSLLPLVFSTVLLDDSGLRSRDRLSKERRERKEESERRREGGSD